MKNNRGERDRRPRYETPVLVPLGEMARGFGAWCSAGGQAGQGAGNCEQGSPATGRCYAGNAANVGSFRPGPQRKPGFR